MFAGRQHLLAAVILAAGCASGDRVDECPEVPVMWTQSDYDGFRLRCDVTPELCSLPVDSTIREGDPGVGIDVVFLGDGYPEAELASYRDRVADLIDALSTDPDGVVGRDPHLFNFHRIDLAAGGPEVELRPLRSCVWKEDSSFILSGDDARVERAAANAPDTDVVVVLVAGSSEARGPAGRTVFGTDIIRMRHEDTYRMLTHELGHALIGLGDEYVDFDRRHYLADRYETWTGNPLPPNLSLDPDEDWGGIVDGAVEGGGRFAYGIYRPTDRCRMLDSHGDVPFCPVCSAAIDEVLAGRRGARDGGPRCGLAVGHRQDGDSREVVYYGRDANGLRSLELQPEGEPGQANDLSLFHPLDPSPPVWFEINTSTRTSGEARVTCVDADGETAESVLTLE